MTETRHLRLPILLVACAALAACGSSTEPAATTSSTRLPPTSTPTTTPGAAPTSPRSGTVAADATVDPASVTVSESGVWSAQGLIRNQGSADEEGMVVTARLVSADGAELETATAAVPVHPVQAGESVPFSLSAQTDTASVADVQWEVSTTTEPPASRDFDFATYWQRATTDDRAVDMYLYTDTPGAPHPYLLFGSVTNAGSAAIDGVMVTVAWLDVDGRVVAVESMPAQLGDRTSLGPGDAADWLFVVDDGAGAAVDGLETQFWGVSS